MTRVFQIRTLRFSRQLDPVPETPLAKETARLSTEALLVFETTWMKPSFWPVRSKSTAKIGNGEKFANSSGIYQPPFFRWPSDRPNPTRAGFLAPTRIFLHIGDSGAERSRFELSGDFEKSLFGLQELELRTR